MGRLVILGTAAVVPDANHDNTHMALEGADGTILIDCASNPVGRLQRMGIHYNDLTDLILTHFHPDHVYGVPILLNNMWLLGRQKPLRVYGLNHCLTRVEETMQFHSWNEWPDFFPVSFYPLLERGNQFVLENSDFRITSWTVRHYVPTIGLRIENKRTGFVTAYTCDTAPTSSLLELCQGADLLIHEAAGEEPLGHSSARQAGETATRTGAKRLVLIHYQVFGKNGPVDPRPLVHEAQETFAGPVQLAEDFQTFEV